MGLSLGANVVCANMRGAAKPKELRKAMHVKAKTVCCRRYAYGGAGYGAPERMLDGESLHTCRYGYADGFLRRRENGVEYASTHAGNLCMDACIRIGKGKRGQGVTLVADADETARKIGTISYEVLCAVTRRAEMVYDYD